MVPEPRAGGDERDRRTPIWLWAAGGAFVVAIAWIVVASVRRPDPPVFDLSSHVQRSVPVGVVGPDTVTLDARSDDVWMRFDLETLAAGTGAIDGWDIAIRRHRMIVNGGEGFMGNAGAVRLESPFGDVREAPGAGYEQSRVTGGGDSVHAVLDDWYDYNLFSHLLEPAGNSTFVVRTAEGRYARLRVLSYYCPGPEPGCMTIEFVLNGDGGTDLGTQASAERLQPGLQLLPSRQQTLGFHLEGGPFGGEPGEFILWRGRVEIGKREPVVDLFETHLDLGDSRRRRVPLPLQVPAVAAASG